TMHNNIILSRKEVSIKRLSLKKNILDIQSGQTFELPHKITLDLFATYRSGDIDGLYVLNPAFKLDFGVQKKFLNDKLIIQAIVNDIFKSYNFDGKVFYNNKDINNMYH